MQYWCSPAPGQKSITKQRIKNDKKDDLRKHFETIERERPILYFHQKKNQKDLKQNKTQTKTKKWRVFKERLSKKQNQGLQKSHKE